MKRPAPGITRVPAFEFDGSLCLLGVQDARNKTGPMLCVTRVPHDNDLVYSDVAELVVAIFEMQHAIFDLDNLSAQAGSAAAINIDLAPDHF